MLERINERAAAGSRSRGVTTLSRIDGFHSFSKHDGSQWEWVVNLEDVGSTKIGTVYGVTVTACVAHRDTNSTDILAYEIGLLHLNEWAGSVTAFTEPEQERRILGRQTWLQGGWQPPLQVVSHVRRINLTRGQRLVLVARANLINGGILSNSNLVYSYKGSLLEAEVG